MEPTNDNFLDQSGSQAVCGTGAKSNKIGYILLPPTLWATVSAVGMQRHGVWAPRTFPHVPRSAVR